MKVALICTAKNEDNYIDEWIYYNFKLGIDKIFIYQNGWEYSGIYENNDNLILVKYENEIPQLVAFNHFIETNYLNFDFAIFVDSDEYIALYKHNNIKEFLSNYLDVYGIGIHQTTYGNNNLTFTEGNYSCVNRFTMREHIPNAHIKTILNFNICKDEPRFNCPHSIIQTNKIMTVDKSKFINGPRSYDDNTDIIRLNHYYWRTFDEYFIKCNQRGWPDTPDRKDTLEICKKNYEDAFNHNIDEDLIAKNFYNKNDKKICIIQQCVKDDNEYYTKMWELSKLLTSAYCKIHNYDYIPEFYNSKDELLLNDNLNMELIPIKKLSQKYVANSFNLILKYLDKYDYVVFLESDAFISNPNIKIEYLLDDIHEFFCSRGNGKYDWIQNLNTLINGLNKILNNDEYKIKFINQYHLFVDEFKNIEKIDLSALFYQYVHDLWRIQEGILIIKNTQKMKDMLKLCAENCSLFQYDDTWQKGLFGCVLSFFLSKDDFKSSVKLVSDYTQGHIYGFEKNKFNIDKSFIMHNYAGVSIEDKLKYGLKLKENKWWKNLALF